LHLINLFPFSLFSLLLELEFANQILLNHAD